jgi:hypothetical protein
MGGSRAFVEWYTLHSAETVRALLPLLVKSGIATEQEVDIETLASRYCDQVLDSGSVIRQLGHTVGAWAHKV